MMQRVLLMSVLFATIVIPLVHARNTAVTQRAGLQRTVWQLAVFIALWTLGCVYIRSLLPR